MPQITAFDRVQAVKEMLKAVAAFDDLLIVQSTVSTTGYRV